MVTFRDKKVLFVAQYEGSDHFDYDYQFNSVIIDPIYNEQLNNLNLEDKIVTSIPENPVFYFGKTSKFPRFKLKTHDYKRCNNYEKSNIQVINNVEYRSVRNTYIFEKDDIYYVIPNFTSRSFYKQKLFSNKYWTWESLKFSSDVDKLQYIKNQYKFDDPIYTGTVYTTFMNEWEDLSKILNNQFNNFITDENLDKIINKGMEDITEQDVDLLSDLLNSSDPSSLEVGLNMLLGYNCSKYRCVIKMLLRNNQLKYTKAWTSTGIKQVKSTIGFNGLGWSFRTLKYYIFSSNEKVYDPDDLRLCHYLWKKLIIPYFNKEMENFNIPGLTFKCYAE